MTAGDELLTKFIIDYSHNKYADMSFRQAASRSVPPLGACGYW
jgi:hypothetical protein